LFCVRFLGSWLSTLSGVLTFSAVTSVLHEYNGN
jgi:hypothetical protein